MDHQAFAQLLGNYGEFVGAIAVVITLGYLAVQIRQNTRAIVHNREVETARNFMARTSQRLEISKVVVESPELAEILVQVDGNNAEPNLEAIDGLSPVDRRRLFSLYRMQALQSESIFFQEQAGLVDQELYESTRRFVAQSADVWFHPNVLSGSRDSFVREVKMARQEIGDR